MTNPSRLKTISKFLSLVLRHEPERIGLVLDEAGWTPVDALLRQAHAAGRTITQELLDEIVRSNDKQRFAFSEDGLRIRANQGHSIDVDLGLLAIAPPDLLYHGTASRFVADILRTGLDRRARHHVHLTQDRNIATTVGQRYGAPVILRIDARRMAQAGHLFRRSANGVWLVDAVPPEFLEVEL